MSDEAELRKLAARVYVQQRVLAELCRRCLVSDDVASLFERLDAALAANFGHESFEAIKEALTAFRVEMAKPIMGRD